MNCFNLNSHNRDQGGMKCILQWGIIGHGLSMFEVTANLSRAQTTSWKVSSTQSKNVQI